MTADTQRYALVLCRTPLQARICLQLVRQHEICTFDLIYLTEHDDTADRTYFERLARLASQSHYLHVRARRPDLLSNVFAIWHLRSVPLRQEYSVIYIASIDSFPFRSVLRKYPEATLNSFDDGTGNFNAASIYHDTTMHRRAKLYAAVMGLPSMGALKRRIRRHFSIYPGFPNIVEPSNIEYLSLFESNEISSESSPINFFIGQPFEQDWSQSEINSLKRWLTSQRVDYYVMHPRERRPLISDIPILDKGGELAEDAIFAASQGRRPTIIAAFSSVLFNISVSSANKIYLSIGSGPAEVARTRLARSSGAEIIKLSEASGWPSVLSDTSTGASG